VQIAAVKITVNDLLKIWPEKSVYPLKPFPAGLGKGFQMILDTAIIIGSLWIAAPILAISSPQLIQSILIFNG